MLENWLSAGNVPLEDIDDDIKGLCAAAREAALEFERRVLSGE